MIRHRWTTADLTGGPVRCRWCGESFSLDAARADCPGPKLAPEGPDEHLRNGLCILGALKAEVELALVSSAANATSIAECFQGLERRIFAALEGVAGKDRTDADRARLSGAL